MGRAWAVVGGRSGRPEAVELGDADTVRVGDPGDRLELSRVHLDTVVVAGVSGLFEVCEGVADSVAELIEELDHGCTSCAVLCLDVA